MLRQTTSLMLTFFMLLALPVWSQQSIKERDFTVTYLPDAVGLAFDQMVVLKAYDSSNTEIPLQTTVSEATTFTIRNTSPSQIIKLAYTYTLDADHTIHNAYLATPSLSTGTIEVFFNHPVDVGFAQTQNAVNLSNTLDDKLISYINACQNTLDIAIYNSYSSGSSTGIAGAINAAYNRGVQVRVIYDGSTSSAMIQHLNANIPTLASPTDIAYGIMHNKFVIFDAYSTDANRPYVWTGSTNWTTGQIDGPDRNNAIMLQDQALALGYTIEFEEMWGSNTMTPNPLLSRFGFNKTDNTPHTYSIGGKIVNSYFSPTDGTNAKIIAAIYSANSDIDIATMLITRTSISNAILSRYNNGLTNINIVVDSQNPSGNQIGTLQAGLAPDHAVQYSSGGIMHHKFMVVDNFDSASDPQVVTGSHNWSTAAETKNDENTLIVHDANITNQYYQAFAYLYTQATGTLAVQQQENSAEISLYPNPAQDYITVSGFDSAGILEFYSVSGAKLYSTIFNRESRIPIQFANGLYIVKVSSENRSVIKKLVVH